MARILFVCTGNTCRSPMAERMARQAYPEHHWESAGVQIWRAGFSPLAQKVMDGMAIDTLTFHSRQVEEVDPQSFDHVVLIGEQAQAKMPLLPEGVQVHRWNVDDPMPPKDASETESLEVYAATAAELRRRIDLLVKELDS